jgi:ribonucleoside-diphosphate reductase alpha chain
MSEALGRVCSLFLRYGEHGNKVQLLIKHLKGIGGSGSVGFGANRVESIADAVAKALELHSEATTVASSASAIEAPEPAYVPSSSTNVTAGKSATPVKIKDLCPSCGSASLVSTEGCKTCTNCGYSKCS